MHLEFIKYLNKRMDNKHLQLVLLLLNTRNCTAHIKHMFYAFM